MVKGLSGLPDPIESLLDPGDLVLERRAPLDRIVVPRCLLHESGKLVYAGYEIGATEANKIVARAELADPVSDWASDSSRGRPRLSRVAPHRGVLDQFLKLANAPDEDILGYARRWGPLLICKHGWPALHPPQPMPPFLKNLESHCLPLGWAGRSGWEPTEAWRRLARLANALLEMRATLQQGRTVERPTWDTEIRDRGWGPRIDPGKTIDSQAAALGRQVNLWVAAGQVMPRMMWGRGSYRVRVGGRTVFGAIAYHLMLVVAQRKARAICDGCTHSYTPARHPRPDVRSYCPTCQRENRSVRDAERNYRARKRLGLRKHEAGEAVEQIARELGSTPKTVAGWIKTARSRNARVSKH